MGEIASEAWSLYARSSTSRSARPGRNGKSPRGRRRWPAAVKETHADWWEARIARQKEIDASIAAKADDSNTSTTGPTRTRRKVRVAGPFTVESLSPHRVVPADEDELIDLIDAREGARRRLHKACRRPISPQMVLDHLRTAGVHQAEKRDTIHFTALNPGPANMSAPRAASWKARRSGAPRSSSARSSAPSSRRRSCRRGARGLEARFDVLIACAFNFDAHASEVAKLGRCRS